MKQFRLLTMLPVGLVLSGCVAGMVASAIDVAAGGGLGGGAPRNSEFMQAAARQACSTHAAQYGAVEVTGIRLADGGEIIVSGTVADAKGKSLFGCSFVTEITAFKLQPSQPGS